MSPILQSKSLIDVGQRKSPANVPSSLVQLKMVRNLTRQNFQSQKGSFTNTTLGHTNFPHLRQSLDQSSFQILNKHIKQNELQLPTINPQYHQNEQVFKAQIYKMKQNKREFRQLSQDHVQELPKEENSSNLAETPIFGTLREKDQKVSLNLGTISSNNKFRSK